MYKVNGRPTSVIYLSEETILTHDIECIIVKHTFEDEDGHNYSVGLTIKEARVLADSIYEMIDALNRSTRPDRSLD